MSGENGQKAIAGSCLSGEGTGREMKQEDWGKILGSVHASHKPHSQRSS